MTSAQTQIRLERSFHATPQELWDAWTDPDQYAKWMNPSGIDLVIHAWDLRPGGKVAFDMPQPDGSPNPQEGVFHELDPPHRLVTGAPDRSFLLDVTFEPSGDRTRMVVVATGVPPEYHEPATIGWNQCFDHLATLLAGRRDEILITRTLDAPPAAIWRAFTDPAAFAQWWGPSGFTTTVRRLDVHVGGTYHYCMHSPDGTDYWGTGEYLEVDAPRRMLMTDNFADADGNVVPASHYGLPDRIGTSHVEVTFEEAGEGRTRFTLRHSGLTGEDRVGATQGWTEMFDKLQAYLTEATA